MGFIINFLFSILSLVLVYKAPEDYSYTYCVMINTIFIFQNILYFIIIRKDSDIICFEFFFMLAFWLTNFVYPIFYYPENPNFGVFINQFNINVITRSTAIAYLGYSFFLLGITKFKRNDDISNIKKPFVLSNLEYKWLFCFTILFFGLYAVSGGINAMSDVYSDGGDIREVGIFSYFFNVFLVSSSLMVIFLFRQANIKSILFYGFFILIISLLVVSTGSRGYVLSIGIILIFTYNTYIKKISILSLILIISLGTFILTFIVYARSVNIHEGSWIETAFSNADFSSFFDLFSDLTCNNRNLYVLVDFADTFNNTYFLGMLSDILSPIPGLFGYLSKAIDIPVEMITGGALPTFLEFGEDSSYGLGTNMVGEAYISFGIVGVISFFYLIGYIVKVTKKASEYNIYAYVIYYLFVSHVIFYPRAPILFEPRTVLWSLMLIYILKRIMGIKDYFILKLSKK